MDISETPPPRSRSILRMPHEHTDLAVTRGPPSPLRQCNLGWMIDSFSPPDQALEYWMNALAAVGREYQRRFGDSSIQFQRKC